MTPLRIPSLDLSREYDEIAPQVQEAIAEVVSRQSFILGEQVLAFETAAAVRCGTRYAVGCASGTDALWLAFAALRITGGEAVVTTPFSFFATVSSILRTRAKPLLADIDPETFNLSPESVRALLETTAETRIRAILPVHLYGQPADWAAFAAIETEFSSRFPSLALVEDAAQAFGAAWNSRPAGSLGRAATFSFYPTKNLSAAGDAGMVTTSDPELAGRLQVLRAHGMRRRYYHEEEEGWNSRLDTIQAAILLVKLQRIDQWTQRRRALAARYNHLFRKAGLAESSTYPRHGIVLPKTRPEAEHVFHQYVIRTRRRDELKSFLAENGIGSEIYYPLPLHLQPALAGLGYKEGDFPESERAGREVLAVPIFPQLTDEEQEAVVDTIARFLS